MLKVNNYCLSCQYTKVTAQSISIYIHLLFIELKDHIINLFQKVTKFIFDRAKLN